MDMMHVPTMAIVHGWNRTGNLGLSLLEGVIWPMKVTESGRGTNERHLVISGWFTRLRGFPSLRGGFDSRMKGCTPIGIRARMHVRVFCPRRRHRESS